MPEFFLSLKFVSLSTVVKVQKAKGTITARNVLTERISEHQRRFFFSSSLPLQVYDPHTTELSQLEVNVIQAW